jgi:hypothetical protein
MLLIISELYFKSTWQKLSEIKALVLIVSSHKSSSDLGNVYESIKLIRISVTKPFPVVKYKSFHTSKNFLFQNNI